MVDAGKQTWTWPGLLLSHGEIRVLSAPARRRRLETVGVSGPRTHSRRQHSTGPRRRRRGGSCTWERRSRRTLGWAARGRPARPLDRWARRRRSDELHACVGAGDRWAHSYGATATCYGHGTRAPCSHRRRRRRRFSIPIVCGVALAPPRLIVVKPAAHCPPCLLNCYSLNIFFISREIETWEGRIVYKSCSFVLWTVLFW
jgi:hypothetical protein